jgi:hypothetical protein
VQILYNSHPDFILSISLGYSQSYYAGKTKPVTATFSIKLTAIEQSELEEITNQLAIQFDQLTLSPRQVNMTLSADVIHFEDIAFRTPTVRFLRLQNHEDVLLSK